MYTPFPHLSHGHESCPNALTTIALTLLSSLARLPVHTIRTVTRQTPQSHLTATTKAKFRHMQNHSPLMLLSQKLHQVILFSYFFSSSSLTSNQELSNFIVVTLAAAISVVSARGNLAPYSLLGLSYFFWVYQMTTRHHNIKKEEVKPAL